MNRSNKKWILISIPLLLISFALYFFPVCFLILIVGFNEIHTVKSEHTITSGAVTAVQMKIDGPSDTGAYIVFKFNNALSKNVKTDNLIYIYDCNWNTEETIFNVYHSDLYDAESRAIYHSRFSSKGIFIDKSVLEGFQRDDRLNMVAIPDETSSNSEAPTGIR